MLDIIHAVCPESVAIADILVKAVAKEKSARGQSMSRYENLTGSSRAAGHIVRQGRTCGWRGEGTN